MVHYTLNNFVWFQILRVEIDLIKDSLKAATKAGKLTQEEARAKSEAIRKKAAAKDKNDD